MPHKHKAKVDASYYNLPPPKAAQSLSVKENATPKTTKPQTKSLKRKHARLDDDTPRAFTRLQSVYRPPRSGLDDGTRPSKQHKSSKATVAPLPLPTPKIQPHEPLSSFNARVDAALPFSGLSKRSHGGKEAEKGRQTKTERKMQKMQKEWREEEQRRRERLWEKEDETGIVGGEMSDLLKVAKKGKLKGGKTKNTGTENSAHRDDDDDDLWAHIKAVRIQGDNEKATNRSRGGLVGLHDVVLALPKWSNVTKGKKNFNNGKDNGGMKRQVDLAEERKNIVEGYRQMMRDKRGDDG